ncbi:MAG: TIR domain-containing protein [Alphaproteobacteria bacterium]
MVSIKKTYVAFDADTDIESYRVMEAWTKKNGDSFNFYDGQDLRDLMSTDSESAVKEKIAERISETKVFILLVGESTKNLHIFVRWEIDQAIKKKIPIVIVNLNGARKIDMDSCPAILRDKLAVHISYNQEIVQHAINTWSAFDADFRKKEKIKPRLYVDSIYEAYRI